MKFIKYFLIYCFIFLPACDSVFFHPTKDAVISPDQIGVKYEAVKIDDGKGPILYGWFLAAEGEALGTILHLHGNAENISTHFAGIYWLPSQSYNVLTIDYRGYGNSQGTPSMQGVHEDALRAANYLKNRFPEPRKPIFLFGQSLGASIALYIASLQETKGLFKAVVAESPFASYRGIAREKLSAFWLTYTFQYPLSWTISSDYDPVKVVELVSPIPLLIVHPQEDEIVSFKNGQELFEKAKEPKQFWIIENVGHIQVFKDAANRKRLLEFFKSNS